MATTALRPVALGEQLAALLRSRIVRGEVAAGTHLVEDNLAREYEVSRGPVRDALRVLLAEGLLESRRRGYYTKPFRQEDIDEIYEIRAAAEQLACRLAIQRSGESDWAPSHKQLDLMGRFAEEGDQHRYAVADLEFHTQFYVLSGNSRLLGLWRQYQPTFATLLDITNAQDADLRPSHHDHSRLLELAEARKIREFGRVLDEHLSGSHERLSLAVADRGAEAVAPQ